MEINYRKATIEDRESLYELGVLLNKFGLELEHDRERFFWEGWEEDIRNEATEELSNPSNIIFIAEDKTNNPIGYIIVKTCDCCGNFSIDQMFVIKEFRGKKIGKTLLDLAIAERKSIHPEVNLEVYKSNKNGIEFYKKYGFKEDGIVMRLTD